MKDWWPDDWFQMKREKKCAREPIVQLANQSHESSAVKVTVAYRLPIMVSSVYESRNWFLDHWSIFYYILVVSYVYESSIGHWSRARGPEVERRDEPP